MVGVSRPNISFWENAKYPPLEAIDKICKVFGMELWKFFTDESFDAQMKNIPEQYSNLQKEILQLSNEEYEDLMNIIAIYVKKHTPLYTRGTDLKTEPQAIEACNDPQAEPQKRQTAGSNISFVFSYTARMAAYNAIVNYTERFLRIM